MSDCRIERPRVGLAARSRTLCLAVLHSHVSNNRCSLAVRLCPTTPYLYPLSHARYCMQSGAIPDKTRLLKRGCLLKGVVFSRKWVSQSMYPACTLHSHELNAGKPFPDENWADRLPLL